ncbi:protein kinase domain-containing protein [Yinghuangia sp. YIM S10712]|uniref:AbiJ-related protein n=1 Tax=Yinghuangia sp. YIM S10712 TaxID=3436930 RepID=UPI003F535C5C
MEELGDGERVLAQTAALFSARGDLDMIDLLRAVRRLDFVRTDDGYVTETNWHDYYWAAVFYVEEIDRPAFTDEVVAHVLPTLIEVCQQNQHGDVDRIEIHPLLPEPTTDWRRSVATAAPPSEAHPNRITEVTRRRIFDALRLADLHWAGGLDDVDFLERIYALDQLPSGDSRFKTAAGDIIQHRFNNQDWDDDWVFTDPRFDLTHGPDDTFLRFLAEMVHPVVRSDPGEVAQLLDLFNEPLGRDGYTITAVDSISGHPVYAGRRIPVSIPTSIADRGPTSNPGTVENSGSSSTGYEAVRRRARGVRRDYAVDAKRWKHGGQADIFQATHKTSGTRVVYKRRTSRMEDPVARMRREIDVSRILEGHAHFMPILDANADDGWIVMPIAQATAAERQGDLQDPRKLLELVHALIDVLSAAHRQGWLHRDITPHNVLLLDGRWTLADWGLVRRPHGQTTKVDRTRFSLGTEGFAAPEMSTAPHAATATCDIYSIGRVISWALTGEKPQTNRQLFPSPGPWRTIVRRTTEPDPQRRPQNVQDLLKLIDTELAGPPASLEDRVRTLGLQAQQGDQAAIEGLFDLAVEHPHHYDLHLQFLTGLRPEAAAAHLLTNPDRATTVLDSFLHLVGGNGNHRVQFGEAARAVMWLHRISAAAVQREAWDLLDEAVRCMFTWDGAWDQWRAQDQVIPWLRTLSGNAASIVAAALHDHPSAASHFGQLAQDGDVDSGIRHQIQTAIGRSRF